MDKLSDMQKYLIGNFTKLPRDVMVKLIEENLELPTAITLCSSSKEFKEWCHKNGVLQKLARDRVKRASPYGMVCGSYLETWNLIHNGQKTTYVFSKSSYRDNSFRLEQYRPYAAEDSIAFFYVVGLMIYPGNYWFIGTVESYGLGFQLFKTKEELKKIVQKYFVYIEDEHEGAYKTYLEEALEEFEEKGGLDGPGIYIPRFGPEDGDQLKFYLKPVRVINQ